MAAVFWSARRSWLHRIHHSYRPLITRGHALRNVSTGDWRTPAGRWCPRAGDIPAIKRPPIAPAQLAFLREDRPRTASDRWLRDHGIETHGFKPRSIETRCGAQYHGIAGQDAPFAAIRTGRDGRRDGGAHARAA